MQGIPTYVSVVAAAIRDPSGRILLQQALPGKRHEGLWELPGGKVDPGETPRAALAREIGEELGLDLAQDAMKPAGFAEDPGGEGAPALVLFLYSCGSWTGDPAGLEDQEWGWFTRDEALAMPLAPMDRMLLDGLALSPSG